ERLAVGLVVEEDGIAEVADLAPGQGVAARLVPRQPADVGRGQVDRATGRAGASPRRVGRRCSHRPNDTPVVRRAWPVTSRSNAACRALRENRAAAFGVPWTNSPPSALPRRSA